MSADWCEADAHPTTFTCPANVFDCAGQSTRTAPSIVTGGSGFCVADPPIQFVPTGGASDPP